MDSALGSERTPQLAPAKVRGTGSKGRSGGKGRRQELQASPQQYPWLRVGAVMPDPFPPPPPPHRSQWLCPGAGPPLASPDGAAAVRRGGRPARPLRTPRHPSLVCAPAWRNRTQKVLWEVGETRGCKFPPAVPWGGREQGVHHFLSHCRGT